MMDAFDEERPAHAPKDLTAWNIEDLQAYIANMTAEIARCEKIIEEKKSLSSAADALFKKQPKQPVAYTKMTRFHFLKDEYG